jgi:HAD superfamily hydrolase (TIGR01459 family)
MTTKEISGLRTISENYEIFILDLWGTIYDGRALFPGIKALLEQLRKRDKKVIFLSNSPQLPEVVHQRLGRLGLSTSHYNHLVTSGGEANSQLISMEPKEFSVFKGTVFEIGPNRFPDTLPKGEFINAENLSQAEWIFNAGPDSEDNQLSDYNELLTMAQKRNLPMLCANPDKIVFHGKEKHLCAGGIAEYYQSIGGHVIFVGKPYPKVFERCMDFATPETKNKTIMIGDNLETDILGANNFGIHSMLIASGVHELVTPHKGGILKGELNELQKNLKVDANYVMPFLRW